MCIFYFACKASAIAPLANGAAALVPVNDVVHLLPIVVVGCIDI